ncbi:MAG: hypothetical protein FWD40_09280 [Treponema sp.]|nr:hypothetical protein [Treponema sp.]
MRKIFLGLLLFVLIAGFASAQQTAFPEITIVNNTGYPMYEMYISPDFDDYWGQDWLKGRTVRNGESVTFRMEWPLSEASVYDICLVDTDDDTYTRMGVNITRAQDRRLTFTFDDFDYDD